MTRIEAIAAAIAAELRKKASVINDTDELRGVVFDIKLKPGTTTVRAVVIRPEFESVLVANGQ